MLKNGNLGNFEYFSWPLASEEQTHFNPLQEGAYMKKNTDDSNKTLLLTDKQNQKHTEECFLLISYFVSQSKEDNNNRISGKWIPLDPCSCLDGQLRIRILTLSPDVGRFKKMASRFREMF